jgi:NADH dehydrogenase FAD-containing subunit
VAPLAPNKIPGVKYVVDLVVKVDNGKVFLKSGGTLQFDYCVYAVGFAIPVVKVQLGASWESRKEEVIRFGAAIRAAKSVAIIGGGAVAVELAGDVRDVVAANTKVTLVCRDGVLKGSSEKYREKAEAVLKERNIEVLNDELSTPESVASALKASYKLKSGESLEADVLIPAYARFQTCFLDKDLLDEQGRVIVNDFMQCPSYRNMFAVGCTSAKEIVNIPKIDGQAKTAITNILKLLAGKEALTKHSENAPFMKSAPLQKIGHDTYAYLDTGNIPPPVACCAKMGFPCCPPPCCWFCVCHPCCCAGPCADPEGVNLAAFAKSIVHKSWPAKGKGETPPAQQHM